MRLAFLAIFSRESCLRNLMACAGWMPALFPVRKNFSRPTCRNDRIMLFSVACSASCVKRLRLCIYFWFADRVRRKLRIPRLDTPSPARVHKCIQADFAACLRLNPPLGFTSSLSRPLHWQGHEVLGRITCGPIEQGNRPRRILREHPPGSVPLTAHRDEITARTGQTERDR